MGRVHGHLPPGSEVAAAFLACLVPVQLWSLISFLREVPAWLLQMGLWDIGFTT